MADCVPNRSASSCDVRFRATSYHLGQGCDLGNCVAQTLRPCVCVWKATNSLKGPPSYLWTLAMSPSLFAAQLTQGNRMSAANIDSHFRNREAAQREGSRVGYPVDISADSLKADIQGQSLLPIVRSESDGGGICMRSGEHMAVENSTSYRPKMREYLF